MTTDRYDLGFATSGPGIRISANNAYVVRPDAEGGTGWQVIARGRAAGSGFRTSAAAELHAEVLHTCEMTGCQPGEVR